MAFSIKRTQTFANGSESLAATDTIAGERLQSASKSLAAAVAGTLTTRTSDTAGTITVASHSLVNGDTVDVYFTAGVATKGTVGAGVTATAIPLTGLGGTALPALNSAVTVGKIVTVNVDADSATTVAFFIGSSKCKCVVRTNSASTPGDSWTLAAGDGITWATGDEAPTLSADVTSLHVSNGTVATGTLEARFLMTGA